MNDETRTPRKAGLPPAEGLYDPQFEKDACGVGFVASIKGEKSHDIIDRALGVLCNLTHRGATGSDANTGDGAGILMQLPDEFLRKECVKLKIALPPAGQYAAGTVFLPERTAQRTECEGLFEEIIREEGQELLGWRTVPTNNAPLGETAKDVEPHIRQIFIAPGKGVSAAAFELKLLVIRKRVEKAVRDSGLEDHTHFHVPSLSTKTLVYKGLLLAEQTRIFYPDLNDPDMKSALAIVHPRYSTNTFPTWDLAHPFRHLAHNGEINTLRGNTNWMRAREAVLASDLLGDDVKKIFPIITPGGSDSMALDNVLELLVACGRSLPHAMMMLVPEAWTSDDRMDEDAKAFYEYHATIQEPWDGPAALAFTDGTVIGATLDRNGLRPARYLVTKDGMIVLASEMGVQEFKPEEIERKGRLQPGRMLIVDTAQKRIIDDSEVKATIFKAKPYKQWVAKNIIDLHDLPPAQSEHQPDHATILARQQIFGYTIEDIRLLFPPMAENGEEVVGSMGIDAPLAVLSNRPQLLYNYFKQLFAQVTNPPIDPIREEMVMALNSYIGREQNLLDLEPKDGHLVRLPYPILSNEELEKLRHIKHADFRSITLPMLFQVNGGEQALREALESLNARAAKAVADGYSLIILTDRGVSPSMAPIPSLLATGSVHHHLIREGTRTKVGIVLESAEAREISHFALLIGFGASAINPYLAFETIADLVNQKVLKSGIDVHKAEVNYIKAVKKGLYKVFSKMGISTLQSYHGAQIFEAIGLNKDVVDRYFTGTPSKINGVGLDVLAKEAAARHQRAFAVSHSSNADLDTGGEYQYRRNKDAEYHLWNPASISKLQDSTRTNNFSSYKEYAELINNQAKNLCTLRGLFKFKPGTPVPLEEVEPAKEIVKRFATGAMSFGSISKEAHENLAIAMNRIGGRSNTGEGGEDPERFVRMPNGDSKRSSIKQIASGRFGVTANYLVNADEIQIKMAQGAKPGEGGQLPGHKVSEFIAKTRYSTPGVTLISPPPHHDIYSIEDLAQLIFDLKNVNPAARVSVKLVSESGVGTVAAGVSKAKADVVLIAGHDGGTGASPVSSIKYAGSPWEIGLAETQQVLVMNDLRGRIIVQADGQMKTGRDVVIAALLGAEEFGFATAPLVVSGCIMMRKCHLNTCPVGVATQDPVLRAKFSGKPEHVVNFFFFIAEEVRELMAQLGVRKLEELVGRVDLLDVKDAVEHWKAKGLDFSAILHKPHAPARIARRKIQDQEHPIVDVLDRQLIELSKDALENKKPVDFKIAVRNRNRTIGAMLSGDVSKRYGLAGLPDNTIVARMSGSAGQSFGAFLAPGVTLTLKGDGNDYVGKGLSGGRVTVAPPDGTTYAPEENIIVGNTVLYGATSGEAYFNGKAGERFAVRNSGAHAVVEGVGDHGCEYMTGGVVVVLGATGRNFAAGMSGGIAFVLDESKDFKRRCNLGMCDLEALTVEDSEMVRLLIEKHVHWTGSPKGKRLLANWPEAAKQFVKVMPVEYRKVLAQLAEKKKLGAAVAGVTVG
jgi:glutamate synthase domain-containing protein 2/glutamate synthase domain-containing protein 1/glutamate synthase domain-containing protein 3